MSVKRSQRILNSFQVPKGFAQLVVFAIFVAEVLFGLIQTTGAFWLSQRPVQSRSYSTHFTHGDCADGYCAKRWNCRYPTSPVVYCGRWRSRKWVCCTGRVPLEMNGNKSTTVMPNPALPPNLHVAGCGIRRHNPSSTTNITFRSATSDGDFETSHGGSSSGAEAPEMMPQPGAVVGGREVYPYSWPWMAAIRRETVAGILRFVCAGSLISNRYVLTAAHVFMPSDVRDPRRLLVVLGSHLAVEGLGLRAEAINVHPSYRMRRYYHDIALVRLERDVVFSDYVRPICLPKPEDQDSELTGKEVTVIGWGDDSFGGVSSPVLMEASFSVVSRQRCNNSYIPIASSTFPNGITQNMLCAGSPSGGMDACQGDSGGPLALQEGNRWIIVGIVSFGYRCGDSEFPGVYTRVSRYLKWIAGNADIIQR